MKTRLNKLNEVYEHLRSLGKVHTKKEFSEQIEFDRSNLSSAFNGVERYLTDGLFKKICEKFPDIFNVEYFLEDKGEMLKNNIARTILDDITYLPLLPISAQGGSLNDFIVSIKDADCEKIISPIKGADFAITVAGDSMAPEYPSGSQILIKKINEQAFIDWGKVYVLDTVNGSVIKILAPSEKDGHVKCISINPDPIYAPFEVAFDDISGIYRVMLCMSMK
ncbi:MAG: S24 family peptidase [Prevotellaceae bacterium]|jgi:hypothetical protein|nr:S24 family peptidase [Prevotellaceae bacterium]